jgi:hypothetical protein
MKTTKQVTIIARYAHKTNGKLNGTVTYLVKSSDGKSTYCTTIVNGEASGCSCPSRSKKGCYHKHQLQALEVARAETPEQKEAREWSEYRAELAKKLAQQYMTVEIVEQVAESLVEMPAQEIVPPIAMDLSVELRGYRKTAVSTDLTNKGNFGSKPFNLLKVG